MKQKNKYYYPLIIFFLFFIVYSASTTNTTTGIADADELTITSFLLSVPHPPGYPFFTLISHLFIKLFSTIVNPAHAANVTSSLYESSALVFIFKINQLLINYFARKKSAIKQEIITILTTVIVGFSFFFWQYATFLEITSFTMLLTAATFYFALNCYSTEKTSTSFYLTWVTAGVLLAHFHLTLIILPALLFLFIRKTPIKAIVFQKSTYFGIALFLLSILLSSLPLLFINQSKLFTWAFSNNLKGIFEHLMRQDYVGTALDTNTTFKSAFPINNIFTPIGLQSIKLLIQMLPNYFNPLVLITMLFGYLYLFKNDKNLFWFTTLLLIASGPFLAGYMQIASYTFETSLFLGIAERHFALFQVSLSLLIIPGLLYILNVFNLKEKTHQKLLSITILLLFVILEISQNHNILTNKQVRQFNYEYQQQVLSSVDQNSIIICSTDIDCFTLWYLQFIENERQDVFVTSPYAIYQNHNPNKDLLYPFTDANEPYYVEFLIAHNLKTKPIYLSSGLGFYDEYLSLENGPLYSSPEDNAIKLTTNYPQNIKYTPINNVVANANKTLDNRQYYLKGIIEHRANSQAYAGFLSLKYNQPETATQYLTEALELDPSNSQTKELITYMTEIQQSVSISEGAPSNPDDLIVAAEEFAQNNDVEAADSYYRQALLISSFKPIIIDKIIDFYNSDNTGILPYIKQLQTAFIYQSEK